MIFKVYGISDCPACLRACADLMANDHEYIFINCDFSKKFRKDIREELSWPTFPLVIATTDKENTFIGGYTELKSYLDNLSDLV